MKMAALLDMACTCHLQPMAIMMQVTVVKLETRTPMRLTHLQGPRRGTQVMIILVLPIIWGVWLLRTVACLLRGHRSLLWGLHRTISARIMPMGRLNSLKVASYYQHSLIPYFTGFAFRSSPDSRKPSQYIVVAHLVYDLKTYGSSLAISSYES